MFLSSLIDNKQCIPQTINEFLPPDNLAEWRLYDWSWLIIGFFAAAAIIISLFQIISHVHNYHKPNIQRYIVRILLIIPIYSIDSFISFKLYWLSVFINVIRDCYEGFVIYNFFCLLTQMLGGYHCAKYLFDTKPVQRLPFPLMCFKINPSRRVLRTLRQLVLQYVFIRPISATIACTLHAVGWYCPGNVSLHHGFIYVSIMNFASVSLAMYALITFYFITQDELAPYNPIPKFFAIKSVIFIMFWQSVLVAALVHFRVLHGVGKFTTDNVSTGLQNALVCVEMLILAIYHGWAFNVNEYKVPSLGNTTKRSSLLNVLNVSDIWTDTMSSFTIRGDLSPLLPLRSVN